MGHGVGCHPFFLSVEPIILIFGETESAVAINAGHQ